MAQRMAAPKRRVPHAGREASAGGQTLRISLNLGLPQDLERIEATRLRSAVAELGEGSRGPVERPVLERLTLPALFGMCVPAEKCAACLWLPLCDVWALMLRKWWRSSGGAGGRNIRPVESQGSDSVRTGSRCR